MSRLYHRPIRVWCEPEGGLPQRFLWRRRLYSVKAVYATWKLAQEWWRKEVRRMYFRVETDRGGPYDIFLELGSGQWFLERVYD